MTKKTATTEIAIQIKPPNIQVASFRITGTAPLVQSRFANKAELMEAHQLGSQSKKGKKKEPKDFEKLYEAAKHRSSEGWLGIPASAFRAGMISACRLVGFKMTFAKLSVFVEADGFDDDGYPLVRLEGEPIMHTGYTRNATGVVDVRARPMFKEWACDLRVRYDADQFSRIDLVNLLSRVGLQVGIGEGRPDSKASAGMGWGTFDVELLGEAGNARRG